ncbi:MAG: AraC family transcriptional regulator, partial [Pseudomonadota bacterium]|nr:AraC family transcriptional regulator [Pseudomonadota bacterium]
MLTFYRNALAAFLAILVLTALVAYLGVMKSKLNASLFPGRDADLLWAAATEPPSPIGKTQISIKNDVGTIEYEFFLDPAQPFPYTHYTLAFIDAVQPHRKVDLTKYSSISFKVQCDPKNVLLLVLFSFDDKVTDMTNASSRRVSSTAFSCDTNWT